MEFTQVLDCLIIGLPISFVALVVLETLVGVLALWNRQVIEYAPESQPINYFPVVEEATEVETQVFSVEEDELEMLLQKEVQDWFDAISEKESAGMEVECKLEFESLKAIALPAAGIALSVANSEVVVPSPKRGRGRPKKTA